MNPKPPQRWSSAPSHAYNDGGTSRRGDFIPSKAQIRQWAKESKVGGRFQCPGCLEFFSVSYSYYGSSGKAFEEEAHWCKDCVCALETFIRK